MIIYVFILYVKYMVPNQHKSTKCVGKWIAMDSDEGVEQCYVGMI